MTTISSFMSSARALGVSVAVSLRTWVSVMSSSSGLLIHTRVAACFVPLQVWPSRRITVEDKIASRYGRVAGKAGVLHRLADRTGPQPVGAVRHDIRAEPGRTPVISC